MSNDEHHKEQDEDEEVEVDIGEEDLQSFAKVGDLTINATDSTIITNVKTNKSGEDDEDEDEDEDSPENVTRRIRAGCECTNACFEDLDIEQVYKHRLNIAELTKIEHDMYLMGLTMASVANSKKTTRRTERQRQRACYIYKGKKVCLAAFLFLENVTLYHIKRIRNHVLTHGVTPRTHGNAGKKPHNVFSLDIYRNVERYVKKYLKNYIKDFSKGQIIYGINRSDIYNSYKDHGRKPDEKLMGFSTFCHFMKEQFPQIKFQKVDPTGKQKHSGPISTSNESSNSKKKNRSSKKPKDAIISRKVITIETIESNDVVNDDEPNVKNNVPEICIENIVEVKNSQISHFDLVPGEVYYLQKVEAIDNN